MSPKAKKPAAAVKAKGTEKAAKTATPAKAGKASKSAKSDELEEKTLEMAKTEGSEDAEEEEEAAAASSSSSSGNAAALAAVTGSTEMSASFKNFRHHPDMENFYRFIFENDLRLEALAIIDEMMVERANRKMVTKAKANAH